MSKTRNEKRKFQFFCEKFHESMKNKEIHPKYDDDEMNDILHGEEGNRRVVLNYIYSGVEFVVILQKIKAEVKFSFQKDKMYDIDKKIQIEMFIKFNKDLNTFQIIEKEKFNQEIDQIITEIITKGTDTTPGTAVKEQDNDDNRFKTLMEVIDEDKSKERIVSTTDSQFVKLLNAFKSSSSSDN